MDKDLLVIGGGINGVGTAADAAGRGLSVILAEMGDLASATSSASSKLIHGGLRYLETGDFTLVRESLRERRILKRLAPHLVRAQAFVMPYCPGLRSFWLLRSGLFIYDLFALGSKMPSSRIVAKTSMANLELKPEYTKALQYYDCTEDDSRLVIHTALLARQHGAEIMSRTKLVKAVRKPTGWVVTLLHNQDLKVFNVKAIVNATGPWVQQTAQEILQIKPKTNVCLVKGSHIVVPKLYAHDQAFILQNQDGRVVFIIPYMQDFTLIGTTDVVLEHIEHPVSVSEEEIEYLCDITNQFLQNTITPNNVVYKYAGIRSLHGDTFGAARKMSRDYILEVDETEPLAPAIFVFGGKITTYRHLAEQVGDKLRKYFPQAGKAWTKNAYLPGGYFPKQDIAAFKQHVYKIYGALPRPLLQHYLDNYGTRTLELLFNSHSISELGRHFGGLLYQREVDYLIQQEWAQTAEDILWRRGKQGLWFSPAQVANLANYLNTVTVKRA